MSLWEWSMTLPSSPRDHLPPPHIHTTLWSPHSATTHPLGTKQPIWSRLYHQRAHCNGAPNTYMKPRRLHIHTKRQLHETDCQSSGMPGMLVNRFFMFLFPFEYRSQLFIEHSKVPLHCVVYNYFHFHTRKCIHFLSHCLGELVPCTQVHISEIGAMLAIIWHRQNHLPGKPLE